jgi:ubiquinone/menaquinone biosynthesis C-methylase UbiE
MLEVGRKKITEQYLEKVITLQTGDSESMPFQTGEFDAVMCAYGVRNFEHLQAGLTEMCRVLRPGGKVVILEFSHPTRFPVKAVLQILFPLHTPYPGQNGVQTQHRLLLPPRIPLWHSPKANASPISSPPAASAKPKHSHLRLG